MPVEKPRKGKKIKALVKLAIAAGKATPAPPVGPALGQHGVAIMDFCKEFNARTSKLGDNIIPVVLTVFEDRSFTFITKTPVTSDLIRKAAGAAKGSAVPNKQKIGKITRAQAEEIAKIKMPDLATKDIDQAVKIIAGTARSMGVEISNA
jgi:large subunit ribosomal protein L11